MEAIVFIIHQIFYATRAILKIGEYPRIFSSFIWGIFAHVMRFDQSRASENICWIIIHNINQLGYIAGRDISENICSILDIMDYAKANNLPGFFMFIDFEKAFDSLEWTFLNRCLELFHFGPSFIRWINVFYKNIQSCTINNGLCTNYFTIERGVRQGDWLSPYLFLIAVEILAIAVRAEKNIRGIEINGTETKLLQFCLI